MKKILTICACALVLQMIVYTSFSGVKVSNSYLMQYFIQGDTNLNDSICKNKKYYRENRMFDTNFIDVSIISQLLNNFDSISLCGIDDIINVFKESNFDDIYAFSDDKCVNTFIFNYYEAFCGKRAIRIEEHCFNDSLMTENMYEKYIDYCNKSLFGYRIEITYIVKVENSVLLISNLIDSESNEPDAMFLRNIFNQLKEKYQIKYMKVEFPVPYSIDNSSSTMKDNFIFKKRKIKRRIIYF